MLLKCSDPVHCWQVPDKDTLKDSRYPYGAGKDAPPAFKQVGA